jgi:predicted transcriptional regulator
MALSIGEWLTISGLILAGSGFNLANVVKDWMKSRKDLFDKLNSLRKECSDETKALETKLRAKLGKHSKVIIDLSSQSQKLTEGYNNQEERLFIIERYLEKNDNFHVKEKLEKLPTLSPYETSFDIEFSDTNLGD